MTGFEFVTAGRIIFGTGVITRIGTVVANILKEQGQGTVLVVTGASVMRFGSLLDHLGNQGIEATTFSVAGEPTIELVQDGVMAAKRASCRLIISIGGGSVVDAGKAIAALLTNEKDPLDYLEVVGRGEPLTHRPAPFIAVPTTAGTGAEVTKNAVLVSREHRAKVSLRSPLMLPDVALLDPALTCGLPPLVTASGGLDALTQLIEPYVSIKANPVTDGLCREGLHRIACSLRQAYYHGDCLQARENMCLASLLSGLALANAGLGAVHGLAGPLGGMFPVPHGVACAALLPHAMAVNIRSLQQRSRDSTALSRYDDIAKILTRRDNADMDDGVREIQALVTELKIPPLREYGISEQDIGIIIERARNASSMRGNPIMLTNEELQVILASAL